MNKKDESLERRLEEELEKEGDLLDFSLDDLSPQGRGKEGAGSESEEEIIELVDVVKEGEKPGTEGGYEIEELLVEDQSMEEMSDLEAPTKELTDAAEVSGETSLGEPETSEVDVSEISLELDMGEVGPLKPEEKPQEDEIPGNEIEKMLEEESTEWEEPAREETQGELPEQEFLEELEPQLEYPQSDLTPVELTGKEPIRVAIEISEEKIEAIVSKAVYDVVEKVTRETILSVAERVIKEAIENLKQSLEAPSD